MSVPKHYTLANLTKMNKKQMKQILRSIYGKSEKEIGLGYFNDPYRKMILELQKKKECIQNFKQYISQTYNIVPHEIIFAKNSNKIIKKGNNKQLTKFKLYINNKSILLKMISIVNILLLILSIAYYYPNIVLVLGALVSFSWLLYSITYYCAIIKYIYILKNWFKYSTYFNRKEMICSEKKKRFVIYPIIYHKIWNLHKKQIACFWTPEEINFNQDITDWTKLNSNEQHFIKHILAFFASADGIVINNLLENIINKVQIPEIKAFYSFQAAMEAIHSETYSLLIDTLISSQNEKNKLFNAIVNITSIKNKTQWALKWMSKNSVFSQRLIAFACVEGIFFSGSFCAIFWLKTRGLMPGLTFSNELISRDEGLHTKFACLLYSLCRIKIDEYTVHQIIKTAVFCEKEFINEALLYNIMGISKESMYRYIQYVADHLAYALGYNKIYNVTNPFDWMQLISLQGKTNFFERRVSEYSKPLVKSEFKLNIGF